MDSGAPWVCVAHAPRLGQPARGRRGRHPRATSWRAGPELDLAAARPTPSRNDRALWRANTNVGAGPKDHRMAWPRLRTVCVRIGDLGAHAHAPKVGVEERRHQVRHASAAKSSAHYPRGPRPREARLLRACRKERLSRQLCADFSVRLGNTPNFSCLRHMALALSLIATTGSNPFTSTVVELTAKNWNVLEQSPHLWMVNVCRQS